MELLYSTYIGQKSKLFSKVYRDFPNIQYIQYRLQGKVYDCQNRVF
jgi:hypothetical protein